MDNLLIELFRRSVKYMKRYIYKFILSFNVFFSSVLLLISLRMQTMLDMSISACFELSKGEYFLSDNNISIILISFCLFVYSVYVYYYRKRKCFSTFIACSIAALTVLLIISIIFLLASNEIFCRLDVEM